MGRSHAKTRMIVGGAISVSECALDMIHSRRIQLHGGLNSERTTFAIRREMHSPSLLCAVHEARVQRNHIVQQDTCWHET